MKNHYLPALDNIYVNPSQGAWHAPLQVGSVGDNGQTPIRAGWVTNKILHTGWLAILILLLTILPACQAAPVTGENGKKTIVVTYSVLGALVTDLAGSQVNVVVPTTATSGDTYVGLWSDSNGFYTTQVKIPIQ